jgi:hypothetical protein
MLSVIWLNVVSPNVVAPKIDYLRRTQPFHFFIFRWFCHFDDDNYVNVPGVNLIKLFTAVIFWMRLRVFVPGKPFQLSLFFARSNVGAYQSGVPFRDSRLRLVDQTHLKHWDGLERLARDKHTSFLWVCPLQAFPA